LLGLWAFRFLLLALAVTPARRAMRWNWLARYRRMLGLFAFFYVTLHLISYAVLDQSLDFGAILHDIFKRPFILVGMAAFVLLIPLAATSTNAAIRRLGKNWRRLHRLVYVVGVLAAVHYVMLVKSWPAQPLIYAALVALLLGYRAVASLRATAIRKT
jgi:sulfoxide reductase heme-binding subunit YedZ